MADLILVNEFGVAMVLENTVGDFKPRVRTQGGIVGPTVLIETVPVVVIDVDGRQKKVGTIDRICESGDTISHEKETNID